MTRAPHKRRNACIDMHDRAAGKVERAEFCEESVAPHPMCDGQYTNVSHRTENRIQAESFIRSM